MTDFWQVIALIEKFPYFAPERCLVNLSNSIAASFGLETFHPTLPSIDSFLSRQRRNVVVVLLDGLGRNILEKHLPEKSFLRSHVIEYFSSVFPPTTVAATTSLLSGKFPIEHGRLGWDMFFPNENKIISVFSNTISGTNVLAAPYNVVWRHYPYESLVARIQESGGHAFFSSAYIVPHPKNFAEVLARVDWLCRLPQRKFIYAYFEQPDGLEHRKGLDSPELIAALQRIDEQLKNFTANLEDTTLIITADHGQVTITRENLNERPDLTECFERPPSLEARAMNFFIREDMRDEFAKRFRAVYGEKDFLLLEMREVLSEKFFGTGIEHPLVKTALGDFLAVALSDKALFVNEKNFVGHHSGMTRDEFTIPLIVAET